MYIGWKTSRIYSILLKMWYWRTYPLHRTFPCSHVHKHICHWHNAHAHCSQEPHIRHASDCTLCPSTLGYTDIHHWCIPRAGCTIQDIHLQTKQFPIQPLQFPKHAFKTNNESIEGSNITYEEEAFNVSVTHKNINQIKCSEIFQLYSSLCQFKESSAHMTIWNKSAS